MKTILIVLFAGLMGITSPQMDDFNSDVQSCSAKLKVEKDRNFKSADENGTSFILFLENTSNSETSFVLNAKNISMSCSRTNKNPENNIELNTSFEFSTMSNNSNEIRLRAGQILEFRVDISVPGGAEYNNWSCIEISATPTSCETEAIKTILSVYVPNPSEG